MYNICFYLFLFYAVICLFQIDKIEHQEKSLRLNKKIFERKLQEEKQKQEFLRSLYY